jgi:pantetheine-phosphate adenylyltransferase
MKSAIYAGTFDPVTHGHLSVIERGARLFDRLTVLIAINPSKQPLLSLEERLELLRQVTRCWSHVECDSTAGYVVDFARARQARYLIRGVRSCTEIEAEITLAHSNRQLAPEVETVFVPAHPELSEVSSSRLKQLVAQGEDVSSYCAPQVVACLQRRLLLSRENAHRPVKVTAAEASPSSDLRPNLLGLPGGG